MEYKTKYRDWLQKYFEEHADEKVCAKDIYERMKADGFSVSLTTVYRNLDRLEKENVLQEHKTGGDDERFYQYLQPQMDCNSHLHLLCSRCGKIIHLNCDFMGEISDHLMKEHGFQVDCRESMLVGLCKECRMELALKKRKEEEGWK
ncbi:MAG: Fur family transcriptional regulator [Lachnospiraceae bacterium]|jgi:Fur family ferric uptake transcriptional regulator